MRLPNFDRIAFAYDALKYLVFGGSLHQAQTFLVPFIPTCSDILIIGGGTGQIILDIVDTKEIKQITYVELSKNMLEAARDRVKSYSNINFVLGSVDQLGAAQSFDVILTPFVLDLYSDGALDPIMRSLDSLLRSGGIWMNTDFKVSTKFGWKMIWQLALVKSMYVFFALMSNLSVFRLPDYDRAFRRLGFKTVQQNSFFGGLVHSQIWERGISPKL